MAPLGATTLLKQLPGELDYLRWSVIGKINSLLMYTQLPRYADYTLTEGLLSPINHTGIHTTKKVEWDCNLQGDHLTALRMMVQVPAIQRNQTTNNAAAWIGRNYDAYYVQNAGFSMIEELCIRTGTQDFPAFTARDLFHLYNEAHDDSRKPIDPNVNRYETVGQLKQVSQGNQIWMVPIMLQVFQQKRAPDMSFPLHEVTGQNTSIKVSFKPILNFTVNEGDYTLLPAMYGTTSTAITSANIGISMLASVVILPKAEREAAKAEYTSSGVYHHFHHHTLITRPSSEAAGELVTFEISPNHTTNGFYAFFQPYYYTDPTTSAGPVQSPNGVGVKNEFDYSAPHGGHSMYGFDLKFNDISIFEPANVPVSFFHCMWSELHNRMEQYSLLYPFTPDIKGLDENSESHTWNPSSVGKLKFLFRKNTSVDGMLFLMFRIRNVMFNKGHYGGMQYT